MSDDPHPPIPAAIYARVSSDEQTKNSSIATQISSCQQYAQQHGMEVWTSHVFIDNGISGATLERPGLSALRMLVRERTIQAVIVHDIDRLSRNLGQLCLLIDEQKQADVAFHAALHPIDATPEGQMLLQIQGTFAEYERAKIRERIMRGIERRLAQGLPNTSTPPYGYRWTHEPHGSTLIIDETEAAVVRQIFHWCIAGWSVRKIARHLTETRVPTQRVQYDLGTKKTPIWQWNFSTIARMLDKPTYLGIVYAHQHKVVDGVWVKLPRECWMEIRIPPIVDLDTFEAAKGQRARNKAKARRNRQHDYLLSGSAFRCGRCGAGMSGAHRYDPYIPRTKPHVQHFYVYYRCSRRFNRVDEDRCAAHVAAWKIEPPLWSFVERLLTRPTLILEMVGLAQAHDMDQRREVQREITHYDQQLAALDHSDSRLIEAYSAGALSIEELKAHREQLYQRKQEVLHQHWAAQETLARLGAPPPASTTLETHVARVEAHLKTGSMAERRQVLDDLGIVVTWRNGQAPLVQGCIPSLVPGVVCAWQTELSLDLNLTFDF